MRHAVAIAIGTVLLAASALPAHAQKTPKAQKKSVTAAPEAPLKLTHVGYGPIRVGMLPQQVTRITGTKFPSYNGKPVSGLHQLDGAFKGVTLYFEEGRLHFIELGAPGMACERGVAVGDNVSTLVRRVKSLEIHSTRYDEDCRDAYAKPHYPECYDDIGMYLRPEFKGKTMRFYLDANDKVVWIRAGVENSVAYDEIHED